MSDATAVQADEQPTPDLEAIQRRINELSSDLTKVAQTCAMPTRILPTPAPHAA